jgi:hypothetical protein
MSSRKIVFKSQLPVLSNGENLRKEWLAHYRAIEKKLFRLRRDWNTFENEAQAEYQSWYHREFANELWILKLLEDECRELQLILNAVEDQIAVNGMTKRNAFLFVMQAVQEKRDPFPTEEERHLDREEKRRVFHEQFKATFSNRLEDEVDTRLLDRARSVVSEWAREKYSGPPRNAREADQRNRTLTEALHEVYEDLKYDQSRKEEDSDSRGGSDYGESTNYSESSSRPKVNASGDVKTLYRKIVRALHPDRGYEMNASEKDLWSQTQIAYQAQDLDQLRTILLRLEGSGNLKVSDFESIGSIMELAKALHEEFEDATYRRNRVKKDPVYRFWASRTKPKNRKILSQDIDISLRQQIFRLRAAVKELNSEMGQYQRRVSR